MLFSTVILIMFNIGGRLLLLFVLATMLIVPRHSYAQAITPISFECGGVATADLGIGDTVSITHSLDQTATFASALVQIPQPPFVLLSAVQSMPYTAGVPVTQVFTVTALPPAGSNIAFAVQNFGNFVVIDCPTYGATITKSVDINNVNTLPSTLTFTIEVENTGTGNLDAPVINDTITQGANTLSLSTAPIVTSGDLDNDGAVDPGETFIYTATYNVSQGNMDDGDDINNVATFAATFLPSITSNVTMTTITTNPSLTVSKFADDTTNVPAGQLVTYNYVVANNGNQVLTNITLSDVHNGSGPTPLPANETLSLDGGLSGGSSDGTANNGVWDTLAPGDEVTFTATYLVTQNDIDTLQ